VKGIEPSCAAWEAAVLPLNYTREEGPIITKPTTGATLDFRTKQALLLSSMARRQTGDQQKDVSPDLLDLMASPKYQPLNKVELARALQVPVNARSRFRKLLNDLETRGKIVRVRKNRYVLPKDADLITGTLHVNRQGFGFVENGSGDGLGDVFISPENMETGMNRDRVVARIIPERPDRRSRFQGTRRSGRIIRVLERRTSLIVGTVKRSKNFVYIIPDDPALTHDIYLQSPALLRTPEGQVKQPEVDDKVVVRLEAWENRHVNPEGSLVEILGPARAPGVAMLSIIRKHDLPTAFPEAVLEQVDRLSDAISAKELSLRADFRQLLVFTIDPEDARDFDDAIHLRQIDGEWEIGIHIADVSHYVRSGTAIDREARRRGNSVYFPDRVLPMLPERLANGLCSLRPGEDHLTKSVLARFDKAGRLVSHKFVASVIRSVHRLTYPEALKRLQGSSNDQLDRDLQQSWKFAQRLRKRRFAAGALDLDVPEARILVDAHGVPAAVHREVNDISHQLIEELMLLANELVARAIRGRALPSVYRVHEPPDPAKLADFSELARSYGFKIGDLNNRRAVQRFLEAIQDHPDESILRIGLLRSLRKARYSPEPLGHFGLAKADYVHFTSPIRRYADLVVHRTFSALLPPRPEQLQLPNSTALLELSDHISLTERVAADAERDAIRQKKLEYLQNCLGKPIRFQATVVEIRNYGLRIEVQEVLMIGLVHVSSLDDDFFIFEPARERLVGRRTRQTFSVGDRLEVRVAAVDFFKQQADFAFVRKLAAAEKGQAGKSGVPRG
jgi:ribonuclease R